MAQQPGYSLGSDLLLTPVSSDINTLVLEMPPYKSNPPVYIHASRIVSKEVGFAAQPSTVDDNLLFQEVFDEHYRSLLYYAKCFLPDTDTARDVVQEVFSNFWLKRETIKEKGAIKSFLYVSTRNKCIDVLRHAKIKQENERMLSYFFDTGKKTEHLSDLETEVTAASTLTLIHKAIEELPDKYKDVVQLSFYDNLSVEEIATRLQLPYKTIHTRKSRAIERLKELFLKYSIFALLLIVNQLFR